ncbi:MAG: DUF933 domain-containing protein [Candidatus Omnitrophica bacterium]|nr:DUF933 domain-containing protein [Candidatus Omnitrophota bacterium]
MKIAVVGLDIAPGKVKYPDEKMEKLVEKFSPGKVSPFFVEFQGEVTPAADAIVSARSRILDVLIPDIEKMETRLRNTTSEPERTLVSRCLQALEQETPLCDLAPLSDEEQSLIKVLAPLSVKPTVVLETLPPVNAVISAILAKAQTVFFYTAGKKEVKSWPIRAGSDILTCAGKIHSDLARGFIKGEVVSFSDFMSVFNMQEAKSRGLVKLVDRGHIIQDGDIIEIRFNV